MPFLVLSGAGLSQVNGRYAHDGTFEGGKLKYKQLGGAAMIFFAHGRWNISAVNRTDLWIYEGQAGSSQMPPSEWVSVDGCQQVEPAPRLLLGTVYDLQGGDMVTLAKDDGDVDWSQCPHNSLRLRFRRFRIVTVERIQDDWFYPMESPRHVAKLAVLGTVAFMGKAHSISRGVLAFPLKAKSGCSSCEKHEGDVKLPCLS